MHTFICKLWSIRGKNKTVQGEINLHCPKKNKVSLNQLKKQNISMLLNSLMIEVINFFLSKTANLNIIIRKRRRMLKPMAHNNKKLEDSGAFICDQKGQSPYLLFSG